MQYLYISLIVLHVFLCFFLVLLILLQNDKGGGLAGAFGGMGGGAAFSGSSSATFLTKITYWLGLGSVVVILILNAMAISGNNTVQRESELKAANKGLSGALPSSSSSGTIKGTPQGIPGLGDTPTEPQQEAPVGAPAGGAGAGESSPE